MTENAKPFSDLPAALVEEVLGKTEELGDKLFKSFKQTKAQRGDMRERLKDLKLLLRESSLGYPPIPTTCATDGSYAIERLLTIDMAAAAAVAVEGLTPPSEKRFWEAPRHRTLVFTEIHHDKTATILRAAMLGEELLLACKAPHDLVLLDCTLALPIIYFNQGISAAGHDQKLDVSRYFLEHAFEYLSAYRDILRSARSDHQFAGIPKYSTRREIGSRAGWPGIYDDRGLLTMMLESSELTKPLPLENPEQPWHIGLQPLRDKQPAAISVVQEIINFLKNVHVFYYKPHDWLPAMRVEVAREVASNPNRLAVVIQGLKHQCATPSMLEPFPLYWADRTVKALSRALPAFRHITTQRVAEKYSDDIGEVFFAMHGYRTEGGR
jgi:hypothetical protein